MLITIDQTGSLEFIAHEQLAGLISEGQATKRRASHVTPCNWLTGKLFTFLRWATGETGAVSDWTRNWPYWFSWGWQVQVVDGPHLGTYAERADAIAAEVAWLEQNKFGGLAQTGAGLAE
jgi:hypothetical protein